MKYLLLFLVCSISFAENWILDTDIPLANARTPGVRSYDTKKKCEAPNPGKTCYEFTGQNLRFRKIVGGVWVDDAPLKAVVDSEISAKAAKQAAKVTRRNKLKTAPADAAAASSIPALRVIVQDMAAELNEIIGN